MEFEKYIVADVDYSSDETDEAKSQYLHALGEAINNAQGFPNYDKDITDTTEVLILSEKHFDEIVDEKFIISWRYVFGVNTEDHKIGEIFGELEEKCDFTFGEPNATFFLWEYESDAKEVLEQN